VEARQGVVVARVPLNGDLPGDYLRAFEIAGRNGLVRLAFGPRAAAHVWARDEAENIVRRLRRRTAIGAYDDRVEEAVGTATVVRG